MKHRDIGAVRHFEDGSTSFLGDVLEVALRKTGVKFRVLKAPHFQIVPLNFRKGWTATEESQLIETARAVGIGATREMVRYRGRYFGPHVVAAGKGLRFYTL